MPGGLSLVNINARKARHQRVFAGVNVLRWPLLSFLGSLEIGIKKSISRGSVWNFHLPRLQFDHFSSSSHKLFLRYVAFVAALFIVGSLSPVNTSFVPADSYRGETDNFWDIVPDTTLITDQDGYLTKLNPQTGIGDRNLVRDRLFHTVAAGETVSTIAAKYSLKSSTIVWNNDIAKSNSIRVNQQLIVPPVDGVYHRVSKGEGIEKIAKNYHVNGADILKQNNMTSGTLLASGDELFIPQGKPLIAQTPARANRNTPARIASLGRAYSALEGTALSDALNSPVGEKPFIFPTHGKLTQGFHPGHYAVDIGNVDRPAIWAAGDGKIVEVVGGCVDVSRSCGGGYGNHVIIDHGNGLKTLYAHLTYSTVQAGEEVKQGQVIGKMGRSGRVHGATGIHLHFEVHKDGVKVLPSKYY